MPKVVYTAAKGLVQSAGSGFDITGATTITGAASVSGNFTGSKKEVKAATVALVIADSGCVLIATGAAKTYTLPAVATAAGFHATFHVRDAAAHVIAGGASKIQGAVFHNTNGTTLARQAVTNQSSITLGANAAVGDYFTIVSDGTNYYVHGWCNAAVTLA